MEKESRKVIRILKKANKLNQFLIKKVITITNLYGHQSSALSVLSKKIDEAVREFADAIKK